MQMSCSARDTARWITTSRQNLSNPAPVYVYFFNHTLNIINWLAPNLGCSHASELPFVFDFQWALWGSAEHALADAFVRQVLLFHFSVDSVEGLLASKAQAVLFLKRFVCQILDIICSNWKSRESRPS